MRKSASWAPAPNLKVLAVERNETDWIVAVGGLDHGTCPVCGIQSISRHSSYRRTLQDLSAQGKPVSAHGFRQSQNVQLDTSNNCVSVAGSMVRVTERVRVRVKAALWASSELALGE